MEKYMISCDWLQVYAHGKKLHQTFENEYLVINGEGWFRIAVESDVFYVKRKDMFTPVYIDVYYVYQDGIKIAEVCQNPRVPMMHPDSTSLRLDNRVLYTQGYIKLLYTLLDALKLYYKGITRIDLCYDCNWLHNHRNPRKFVRDIVTIQAGTKGHIYRKGTSKGTLHFDRSPVGEAYFSSISWGSYKGDYTCKIYNKTQEMCEVKTKPWIMESWEIAGLKNTIDESWFKLEKDKKEKLIKAGKTMQYIDDEVWRFEISIQSRGKDMLDMTTGLLFRLSPEYVENQERLEFLFHQWAKRAFDFYISTGQKNYRHYPQLTVFENGTETIYKPIHLSNKMGAGRMEKVVANKLSQLKQAVLISDPILATEIDSVEVHFRERAGLKQHYVPLLRDLFNQYEIPVLATNEEYRIMLHELVYIVQASIYESVKGKVKEYFND